MGLDRVAELVRGEADASPRSCTSSGATTSTAEGRAQLTHDVQLGKQAPARVITGACVSTRDLARPQPFHGNPCRHAPGVNAGLNCPADLGVIGFRPR